MKRRAALIGCGRIGWELSDDPRAAARGVCTHAEAYACCPNTELVAVCDADMGRAQACAKRWRVNAVYQDPWQLLSEQRPEIVSICTPDATHYDVVRAGLEADEVRGILAEKPLSLTVAEAEDLVALARRRNVVLAVNYSRRYTENHCRLRTELRRGRIGALRVIRGLYTKGTLHNATHWFDLVRFLAGEVTAVRAIDRLREPGPDPSLDVYLDCGKTTTAELVACTESDYTVFEMDLLGTLGRVRITECGEAMEFFEVCDGVPFAGYRGLVSRERTTGGFKDQLLHALMDLVECVNTQSVPRCAGADGIRALQIGHAARASAAQGIPIPLAST
jgi:predicted dehydrogenase